MVQAYSWDIETAKVLPLNADLQAEMPLGITCAAGLATDAHPENTVNWWAGMRLDDQQYLGQMTLAETEEMVKYVAQMHMLGYPAMTWNGVGFEWLEIAWETNWWQECKVMALLHYDLFFHLFGLCGYFVSFDRAMRGMGLPGKGASDMTGAEAPELWPKDPERVLAYVRQDVIQPVEFARRVEENGYAVWAYKQSEGVVNRGMKRYARGFGNAGLSEWLPVHKVLDLPLPDTSGFTRPPPTREQVLGWITDLPKLRDTDVSDWHLPKEILELGLENDF